MGIDTNFTMKNQPFNVSWKRYYTDKNITIPPNKIFSRDTSFFTIGSCFANELRSSLTRKGFNTYPKASPEVHGLYPAELKKNPAWGPWDDLVNLQFYNTFSLRQEFEKAFGVWTQSPDDYFTVETESGTQYWDPYRRSIWADSPEKLATINASLDNAMKAGIHNADVGVVTLGLIEIFRRKDNGKVTCQYNRHFAKHVQFEVSDYVQNLENAKAICDLFFGHFPNKKLIVTTSPVALAQTFRDMDVVVANSESKSLLRTVNGEIARTYKNVIYWPSYEICMFNENSFEIDLRHVRRERVDQIIDSFVASHIKDDTASNAA